MRACRPAWLLAATAALWLLMRPRSACAQMDAGSVVVEAFPYASRGDRAQVSTSSLRLSAGVPLFLGKRTILVPGLSYERFEANVRSSSGLPSLVLHAPALSVTLIRPLGERVTVMARVSNGLASDLREPLREADFLFSGLALALYRFRPSLTLGGGILYDRRLGSLQPAPMMVLNWRLSENLRLAGVVPAMVNLEHRATPWMTTALRATLTGNRYQFGERPYASRRLQLATSNVAVGPALTFHVGPWLHLDVYAAAAVHRRYEVIDRGQRIGDDSLPVVVGYGLRLWVGPSGWEPPAAAPPR